MTNHVILITGASSGIGYTTAKALAAEGHCVYAAARRVDKLADLITEGIHPITLDITDSNAIHTCVQQIIDEQGRFDSLINNAGYGFYGPVEDVSLSDARRQFDVNLFGLAELTQAVLPYMREQQSGRIINVGSMGGRFTSYFGGWYHATKYALEAYSDALRMEVANFGIQVVLVEPGLIKTDWGLIAANHLAAGSQNTAYADATEKSAKQLRDMYQSSRPSDPSIIARTLVTASATAKPRPRYLVGYGAKVLVFLHWLLPTRWFDRLMRRMG